MTNTANAASREARARELLAVEVERTTEQATRHYIDKVKRGDNCFVYAHDAIAAMLAFADEAASQPREVPPGFTIEGSIYTGFDACLVRDGKTVAHVVTYADALAMASALHDTAPTDQAQGGRTPEPAPQDNAEIVERCAQVAETHDPLGYMSERERSYCREHGEEIAAAIRALATPIQGEI